MVRAANRWADAAVNGAGPTFREFRRRRADSSLPNPDYSASAISAPGDSTRSANGYPASGHHTPASTNGYTRIRRSASSGYCCAPTSANSHAPGCSYINATSADSYPSASHQHVSAPSANSYAVVLRANGHTTSRYRYAPSGYGHAMRGAALPVKPRR